MNQKLCIKPSTRGSPGASLRLQTWHGRTPTWPEKGQALSMNSPWKNHWLLPSVRRSPMDEGRFQNREGEGNETHVLRTMGGWGLIIILYIYNTPQDFAANRLCWNMLECSAAHLVGWLVFAPLSNGLPAAINVGTFSNSFFSTAIPWQGFCRGSKWIKLGQQVETNGDYLWVSSLRFIFMSCRKIRICDHQTWWSRIKKATIETPDAPGNWRFDRRSCLGFLNPCERPIKRLWMFRKFLPHPEIGCNT